MDCKKRIMDWLGWIWASRLPFFVVLIVHFVTFQALATPLHQQMNALISEGKFEEAIALLESSYINEKPLSDAPAEFSLLLFTMLATKKEKESLIKDLVTLSLKAGASIHSLTIRKDASAIDIVFNLLADPERFFQSYLKDGKQDFLERLNKIATWYLNLLFRENYLKGDYLIVKLNDLPLDQAALFFFPQLLDVFLLNVPPEQVDTDQFNLPLHVITKKDLGFHDKFNYLKKIVALWDAKWGRQRRRMAFNHQTNETLSEPSLHYVREQSKDQSSLHILYLVPMLLDVAEVKEVIALIKFLVSHGAEPDSLTKILNSVDVGNSIFFSQEKPEELKRYLRDNWDQLIRLYESSQGQALPKDCRLALGGQLH